MKIILTGVTFSSMSILATYISLQSVTLTTLTLPRLEWLLHHHLTSTSKGGGEGVEVLTPLQMQLLEVGLSVPKVPGVKQIIRVNADLMEVFETSEALQETVKRCLTRKYLLVNGGKARGQEAKNVYILFKQEANKAEVVEGLLHAFLLRDCMAALHARDSYPKKKKEEEEEVWNRAALRLATCAYTS